MIIELNMKSALLCSKHVSKVMVAQKSGNIINIGSESVFGLTQANWPMGS